MILLDTNVLSEMRKVSVGHPGVKAWAAAQPTAMLFISAITVLEIERGVYKALQQGDEAKARIFTKWLDEQVLPTFGGRILAVDHHVARQAAKLPWSDSKDSRDAMIAATALVHRATVATRNIKHFEASGVKLLNPWDEQA